MHIRNPVVDTVNAHVEFMLKAYSPINDNMHALATIMIAIILYFSNLNFKLSPYCEYIFVMIGGCGINIVCPNKIDT